VDTVTTSDVTEPTTAAASSSADLGLLVLRVAVSATMLQAGLIKALDINSVVTFMEDGGWRQARFAAYTVTGAELAGGIGLLLGLLTPLAAAAVAAAMIDAWAVNVSGAALWSDPFNVPFLVAFSATALMFTGAGRHSVDARVFGWSRWPGFVSVVMFVVAVAAAVATWILLNGTNPIHFSDPTG
jgi:uncharacterized membrane protein YphA (DoxX/SURF4 family)